jgi:hypothetical protein
MNLFAEVDQAWMSLEPLLDLLKLRVRGVAEETDVPFALVLGKRDDTLLCILDPIGGVRLQLVCKQSSRQGEETH